MSTELVEQENIMRNVISLFLYTNDLMCEYSQTNKEVFLRHHFLSSYGGLCIAGASSYMCDIRPDIDYIVNMEHCNKIDLNYGLGSLSDPIIISFDMVSKHISYVSYLHLILTQDNIYQIKSGRKILVAPVPILYLSDGASTGLGHMTALVIDTASKKIEYFDPNYNPKDTERVNIIENMIQTSILTREFYGDLFDGYSFVTSHQIFGDKGGWQHISDNYLIKLYGITLTPEEKNMYVAGYCVMWTLLYCIIRTITLDYPSEETSSLIGKLLPEVAFETSLRYKNNMNEPVESSTELSLSILIRNFASNVIKGLLEDTCDPEFLDNRSLQIYRSELMEIDYKDEINHCGNSRLYGDANKVVKQYKKVKSREKSRR